VALAFQAAFQAAMPPFKGAFFPSLPALSTTALRASVVNTKLPASPGQGALVNNYARHNTRRFQYLQALTASACV
jgi:hypothetical protein